MTVFSDASVLSVWGLRGLIAGCLLLLTFRSQIMGQLNPKGFLWVLGSVLSGFLVSNFLSIHGGEDTTISYRFVISLTMPIIAYLIAVAIRQEGWNPQKFGGLAFCFAAFVFQVGVKIQSVVFAIANS